MNHLHSRLATLSEDQLRSMVLRVASQDPYFCDVFAMELGEALDAYTSEVENISPPTLPAVPDHKKSRHRRATRPRTFSNTLVHFPPTRPVTPGSDQEEYDFHPGQLETEEYEFLTVTQEGRAYRRVQTVSMWSCCEGDDTSAGCKIASAHTILSGHSGSRQCHTRTKSKKRLPARVPRA